jgi:predicted nucleic acid-binding protein
MPWIGVSDEIADEAGRLARRYRRSHAGVGIVDFIIAATARSLAGDLWTHNARHFPMFASLRPPY